MAKKYEKKLPERLEDALSELEKIVAKLESPDLPLEESIQLFERGSALSELCYSKLQEAEKKVELLMKKAPQAKGREDFEAQKFGAN